MKKTILFTVILCAVSSCFADMITYTGTITSTNPFQSDFTVPLLNPSVGTLDSVLVSFNTVTSGTISATNNGEADTFSIDGQEDVRLIWPDSSWTYAFSKPAHSYGSPYVDAGETKVYTVEAFYGSSSYLASAPADLALFTGIGDAALSLRGAYSYAWAATYGAPYTIAPNLNTICNWTIEYTYTIPEPMTLSMLGLGCLLFRRK
jgi:hypothetical protein